MSTGQDAALLKIVLASYYGIIKFFKLQHILWLPHLKVSFNRMLSEQNSVTIKKTVCPAPVT